MRQHLLRWSPDPQSVALAKMICLLRSDEPQAQYAGDDLWEATWAANTLRGSFPAYCRHSTRKGYLLCSPQNAVECFGEGKVLEGLPLTLGWGGMTRTKRYIYDYSKRTGRRRRSSCTKRIATGSRSISCAHADVVLRPTRATRNGGASLIVRFVARNALVLPQPLC